MLTTITTGERLKINVHSRDGFTPAEVEKHTIACNLLETVLNSQEFYIRMMALRLTSVGSTTNLEIYNRIMSGAETLDPTDDHEIDVYVEAYYSNNSVVGYTYFNIIKTYLNKKFFDQYNYAEIACNLFHEWLHKIGFDHASAKDLMSAPYALGYLVEDLVNQVMKGIVLTQIDGTFSTPEIPQPPKQVLVCSRSWRTFFLKRCYLEDAI